MLIALLLLASSAQAQYDCGEGGRVLEGDCPETLKIFSAKVTDPHGKRRRNVLMRFEDGSGEVVYVQIVRGNRNRNRAQDADMPRYAIDICAWAKDGVTQPLLNQIGGDESVSVCCNHEEEDDDCPAPSDLPLPLQSEIGGNRTAAYNALDTLAQMFYYLDMPWHRRWTYEESAFVSLASPVRNTMRNAITSTAYEVPAGYNGVVIDADSGEVTPTGDGMTAGARTHTSYHHIISVHRAPMAQCGNIPFIGCEHSATWAFRCKQGVGCEEAWYKCNHGRCPWGKNMQTMCWFQSYPNRTSHVHLTTCNSRYDYTSITGGHNCNDDTWREYASVYGNRHVGDGDTGSPCADWYIHNYPTRCW